MPDADVTHVFALEQELRVLSVQLTTPRKGECLPCYVYRVLDLGCLGLRWATRFRDLRAPRATALLDRLADRGVGCDCELFTNAFRLRSQYLVVDPRSGEVDFPELLPDCLTVRATSTQPCALWVRRP